MMMDFLKSKEVIGHNPNYCNLLFSQKKKKIKYYCWIQI